MTTDDPEESGPEGAEGGLDLSSLLQGFLGGGTDPESGAELGAGAGGAGGSDLGALLGGLLGGGIPDAAGGTGGAGGMDLGALLGGLLGGGIPDVAGGTGGAGGMDLGGLLGGLLGGGSGTATGSGLLGGLLSGLAGAPGEQAPGQPGLDVNGLAESIGVTPSIIQAAIPLVLGGLLKGNFQGRMGDQPLDEAAVRATGLPQELAAQTGLDLPKAVQTVQQILDWLRKATKPQGSASGAKARPKKRRRIPASSRPASSARPKKKTSSSAPAKGKARPKPETEKPASSTRPKRRRKTTTGSK